MKQRAINTDKYPEDVALWQAFKQGDKQAYSTLYHQYVRLLFQYGCRLCSDRDLVKDAIQDVFFYLWEHRSTLGDVQRVQYYLTTALRRKIIALQKKESSIEVDENMLSIPSVEKNRVDAETKHDNQRYLQKGLNNLTERPREAIFLRYYQDMPVNDIAKTMNIQRRAVYQLLENAIRMLIKTWPEMAQKVIKMTGWIILSFNIL